MQSRKSVTCPYCGEEMTLNGLGKLNWYFCMYCGANAPNAQSEAEAYELAMRRAEA